MTFSSSLSAEANSTVALDTSVIINLEFCRIGKQILQLIDNHFVITNEVAIEVGGGEEGSLYVKSQAFMQELLDEKILEVVNLSFEETKYFRQLTKTQRGLGDGEATTIAVSARRGFIPVIDEKQGRTLAKIELNDRTVARSVGRFTASYCTVIL